MHLWSMSTFIIFPIYHQPYHLDLYTLAHPRRHSPHLYGRMARWTRHPRWSRVWRSCPRPSRPTPSRWKGRAPRHGCSWHGKVVPQVMTNVYGECDDSDVDLGWNLRELGVRDIRCYLDGTNTQRENWDASDETKLQEVFHSCEHGGPLPIWAACILNYLSLSVWKSANQSGWW